MDMKIPVLAVVGPTAAGKTSLGLRLAETFSGEIVSCDSMQIYRGLPIGTAQPTEEELRRVPHHLVGFLDPWESFSVSDYEKLASQAIADIHARGKLPVLVGGTGLYARSLLRGFVFEDHGRDDGLRRRLFLRAEAEGPGALYRELLERDPEGAAAIHPNNLKRVIRALEYCILTGEPFSAQTERSHSAQSPYDYLLICLSYRDRQKLYDRIDRRVDGMLEAGLLQEAEAFWQACRQKGTPPTAAQAIGYKELFPCFEGSASLGEASENLKRESRRYAKRQITWFSADPEAVRVFADDFERFDDLVNECQTLVRQHFEKGETAGEQ